MPQDRDDWMREWGVADPAVNAGGLTKPQPEPSPRQVILLQRKASALGKGLGKTSGWVHRAALKAREVEMVGGVNYERIDDAGLHISFGDKHERARVIEVDDVVICAGQESRRDLVADLRGGGRDRPRHRRRRRRGRTGRRSAPSTRARD